MPRRTISSDDEMAPDYGTDPETPAPSPPRQKRRLNEDVVDNVWAEAVNHLVPGRTPEAIAGACDRVVEQATHEFKQVAKVHQAEMLEKIQSVEAAVTEHITALKKGLPDVFRLAGASNELKDRIAAEYLVRLREVRDEQMTDDMRAALRKLDHFAQSSNLTLEEVLRRARAYESSEGRQNDEITRLKKDVELAQKRLQTQLTEKEQQCNNLIEIQKRRQKQLEEEISGLKRAKEKAEEETTAITQAKQKAEEETMALTRAKATAEEQITALKRANEKAETKAKAQVKAISVLMKEQMRKQIDSFCDSFASDSQE